MSKSCGVSEKKFANPTLLQDLPSQLGTVCPLATQAFAKCVVSRRSSMSLRMNGVKGLQDQEKLLQIQSAVSALQERELQAGPPPVTSSGSATKKGCCAKTVGAALRETRHLRETRWTLLRFLCPSQ